MELEADIRGRTYTLGIVVGDKDVGLAAGDPTSVVQVLEVGDASTGKRVF